MNDNKGKVIVVITFLVVAALFCGWWYSHVEDSTGVVDTKWVETNVSTSCDKDGKNCTTTTTQTYLIQLKDGRVYDMLWGNHDWDQIHQGDTIGYEARGMQVHLWGWRIANPTIFSYKILEKAPNS